MLYIYFLGFKPLEILAVRNAVHSGENVSLKISNLSGSQTFCLVISVIFTTIKTWSTANKRVCHPTEFPFFHISASIVALNEWPNKFLPFFINEIFSDGEQLNFKMKSLLMLNFVVNYFCITRTIPLIIPLMKLKRYCFINQIF